MVVYYGMFSNAKDDYPIIILGGGDFTGLEEHGCLGDTSSNVSIVTSNSIFFTSLNLFTLFVLQYLKVCIKLSPLVIISPLHGLYCSGDFRYTIVAHQ